MADGGINLFGVEVRLPDLQASCNLGPDKPGYAFCQAYFDTAALAFRTAVKKLRDIVEGNNGQLYFGSLQVNKLEDVCPDIPSEDVHVSLESYRGLFERLETCKARLKRITFLDAPMQCSKDDKKRAAYGCIEASLGYSSGTISTLIYLPRGGLMSMNVIYRSCIELKVGLNGESRSIEIHLPPGYSAEERAGFIDKSWNTYRLTYLNSGYESSRTLEIKIAGPAFTTNEDVCEMVPVEIFNIPVPKLP